MTPRMPRAPFVGSEPFALGGPGRSARPALRSLRIALALALALAPLLAPTPAFAQAIDTMGGLATRGSKRVRNDLAAPGVTLVPTTTASGGGVAVVGRF